jgi:hypothetical protein
MGGPKHPKVRSQNALLQGRSWWKTLLEHTVQDQIFESYEHRSKIILQLLTSFVFLKVGFAPHRRIYSWFKHITTVNC